MRNNDDLWLLLVVECALATLLAIKEGASELFSIFVGIMAGITVLLLVINYNNRKRL